MTENDKSRTAIIDVLERAFAVDAVDVFIAPGRAASGAKYKPSTNQTSSPFRGHRVPEIITLGEPIDQKTFSSIAAYLKDQDGIFFAAGARHRFSAQGSTVSFRRLLSLEQASTSVKNSRLPINQDEGAR